MTWAGDKVTAMDLYYDPVVDEHVGHGPMGLIAPAWYMAPQRRDVGQTAWNMGAMLSGVLGDGDIMGLDDENLGVMLVQLAGEYGDEATKARLWDAADAHFEPTWDVDAGEFTMGLRLDEPYPRGQLNARAMAGWICTTGAWSDVFNNPNLTKFDEPTVTAVDFPRVAMTEARWDGDALHVAAHPQNASVRDTRTTVTLAGLPTGEWQATQPDGAAVDLVRASNRDVQLELTVDDQIVKVSAR
jgi:hypothetical protein